VYSKNKAIGLAVAIVLEGTVSTLSCTVILYVLYTVMSSSIVCTVMCVVADGVTSSLSHTFTVYQLTSSHVSY